MYTILVNNDDSIRVSLKERIIQGSKLVDNFCFLVSPEYKGYDMRTFTVAVEYLKPESKTSKMEFLKLSNELYNGYLKYELPIDSAFTNEAGDVKVRLVFTRVELDDRGKSIQAVRRTNEAIVYVSPSSDWSATIPDSALAAFDQRLIMMNAQIRALDELANRLLKQNEELEKKLNDNIHSNLKGGQ